MTTTSAHVDEASLPAVAIASSKVAPIVVENAGARARVRRTERSRALQGDILLLAVVDIAAVATVTAVYGGRLELLVGGLALALCATSPLYRFRPQLSLLDDLPRLMSRILLTVLVGITGQALVRSVVDTQRFLVVGVQLLAVLVLAKMLTYPLIRHGRRAGWFAQPTLILGGGRDAAQLASVLRDHREYGLDPVGILGGDTSIATRSGPVPLLGCISDLPALLEEHGIRRVIAELAPAHGSEAANVLRWCAGAHAELMLVPRLHELTTDVTNGTHAWGLPLVPLHGGAFASPTWRLKRAFDVAVSGVALFLLSPLLLACAAAVLVESGRPVLFRQERVGVNGKLFSLLKFRSMRPASPAEEHQEWVVVDESRVGPVGKLLRRSSLDELPQLWNVLVGHMSLVGPRPERPHFVNEFSVTYAHYEDRHRVPVGMTGLAQVHGLRGDTSIEDRVRFDNYYIETWSLWGDLKILLRTGVAVFRRPAA